MNLHPRVIVLLALLLSTGCLYSEFAPGESTTATLDSFRENGLFFESDLMTQPGLDQSILPAYLRDRNVADIIVATVAEDNVKTLQLFEMHQGYYRANASVVRQLDEKVIFLDVAATVGREMLVVFYAGYAVELDPVDGATKPLIEFSSIYNGPVDQQLPKLDLAR
ncbi:MAG: hypothetical protein ACI8W1_001949, partial [Candidatus Azotimanducaceae bacterium]